MAIPGFLRKQVVGRSAGAAGMVSSHIGRSAALGLTRNSGGMFGNSQMLRGTGMPLSSPRGPRMAGSLARPTGPRMGGTLAPPSLPRSVGRRNMLGGRRGKLLAGAVAAGGVYGMATNRSGRAADKVSGRPTGMYGF